MRKNEPEQEAYLLLINVGSSMKTAHNSNSTAGQLSTGGSKLRLSEASILLCMIFLELSGFGCDGRVATNSVNSYSSECVDSHGATSEVSIIPTMASKGIELGNILPGEMGIAVFEITNYSSVTWMLPESSIRKSCGCVSASLSKAILEPGQTSELTLSVDTKVRRGYFHEFTEISCLEADGRIAHVCEFVVRGVVKPLINVSPDRGKLYSNNSESLRLDVEVDSSRLSVDRLQIEELPGLQVKLTKRTESQCSVDVSVLDWSAWRAPEQIVFLEVAAPHKDGSQIETTRIEVELRNRRAIAVHPSVVKLKRQGESIVGELSLLGGGVTRMSELQASIGESEFELSVVQQKANFAKVSLCMKVPVEAGLSPRVGRIDLFPFKLSVPFVVEE